MVWTPEQTGQFLDFVAEDRLYPLWRLIAFRGTRRGEACGVRWVDHSAAAQSLAIATQQLGAPVERYRPQGRRYSRRPHQRRTGGGVQPGR